VLQGIVDHGCETWSLAVREQNTVSENNMAFRWVLGREGSPTTVRRKLHSKRLLNLQAACLKFMTVIKYIILLLAWYKLEILGIATS
jgi:hypothetical protein